MDLKDALEGVRTLGYEASLGSGQPAQRHLREARAAIADLLPPLGLRVRASGAAVNLPAVPWLAVMNPEVTTTAQSGLYMVYLFSAELDRVYLSMNQGVTAIRERVRESADRGGRTIDQVALEVLGAESEAIRAMLPASLVGGLGQNIELDSTGYLPAAYTAGNIASAAYDLRDLPVESSLRADLSRFLAIYDAAVEARSVLTASDPERYRTRAIAAPGGPAAGAEFFRPKDSSEYVARVAARTEVRSRRHEAVVRAFGEFAAGQGFRPNTNVHPRDLTITRDGRDILCEVKVVRANAEHAVREAIGQLFTYRYFLYAEPPAGLLAVYSDPIGEAFSDLQDALGIASVWATGDGHWSGSALAANLGIRLAARIASV